MPGVKTRGDSTRNVHSVETSSGMATSLAPRNGRVARCRAQAQVAVRVFQADDGAVDHRSNGERHAGQSHDVDALAREIESARRGQASRSASVMIAMAVIRISPRNIRMTSEQRMAPKTPS